MSIRQRVLLGSVMTVCGSLLLAAPASALTINPVFGSVGEDYGVGPTVDLSGNAAAVGAIDAAAHQISSQFGNDLTVNIMFVGAHDGPNGFLGASLSGQTAYTYDQYTTALKKDSTGHLTNSTLASAVSNLPSGNGASDPSNTMVLPTTPLARLLGLGVGVPTEFGPANSTPQFDNSGVYLGGGGTVDAVIFLNLDNPLSFTRPVPDISSGVVFDAQSTMEHEIDEVLGIGGSGSTLNDLLDDPNFAEDFFGVTPAGNLLGALDLYRYSNGLASYAVDSDFTDPSQVQSAYFSIDGGLTPIDFFNQQFMAFGDAADWALTFSVCPGGDFVDRLHCRCRNHFKHCLDGPD